MIPRTGLMRHDPENGTIGDCYRAAIASMLDLKVRDVPHFLAEANSEADFWERVDDFLDDFDLVRIAIEVNGSMDLDALLRWIGELNPGICCIVAGGSLDPGVGHVVIACDGLIVHDPDPNGGGLLGPLPSGVWLINFLGSSIARRWGAVE